jgi:hypothetical protein
MDRLKELFYDPKTGYVDLKTLKEYNKIYNLNLTNKDIEKWYYEQSVNQIYKQNNKVNIKYNHVVNKYNEPGVLQADLMDFKRFYHQNNGYKYLLNIIDIYSRFAWTFPIKSKKPEEITPHIEHVLKLLNDSIYKTLTVDKGGEFCGIVLDVLKKYNVKKYTNDPHAIDAKHITSVVERYNRSLLTKLKKYMTSNNTLKYIDVIDDLVYNYNNSIHSTIKMKPIDKFKVKEPIHINLDEDVNEKNETNENDILNIGDNVRSIKKRKTFDKWGFVPQYSIKLHQIIDKKGRKYKLDNGRLYYPEYLIKVEKTDDNTNNEKYRKEIKENKKRMKIETENIKEGIDMNQIVSTKRERKRNTKYDNDYV